MLKDYNLITTIEAKATRGFKPQVAFFFELDPQESRAWWKREQSLINGKKGEQITEIPNQKPKPE